MMCPNRIVSLCPSITETLYALGAWPQVVGRTKFCVHPKAAIDQIAVVGGTKRPKIETIEALRPDLVLLNEEENRIEDAQELKKRGFRVVSYFPKTLPETADYIESLGRLTGHDEEGKVLAEALRKTVASERYSGAKIRFVYFIWRNPWMAVSGDTFISRVLETAGFENAISGDERYPTVEPTSLSELKADVVFLSSEPFPFTEVHRDELADLSNIDAQDVHSVDGELLSWHGVRTVAGVKYARQLRECVGRA
jgi:ABC-type Fe3+-hydroxamate transport system substrate-binding protein